MIVEPPSQMTGDEAARLVDQRRLRDLLRRQNEIASNNGLALYKPHVKQDAFHRHGMFKRRYARTGNRFGKSLMGTAEDCGWALGERIWYSKDDPARYVGIPKRSTSGLIIVQDWDQADKIFTSQDDGQNKGKLFKLLPSSSIVEIRKNQAGEINGVVVKCLHGGNSTITIDTIKSFKTNPMGHESADWDWIHIDEPCPEDMWEAISRGLIDRGGSAWFTCTPIIEMWINDLFVMRGQMRMDFPDGAVRPDNENYWIITGSMHDNPTLKAADKQLYIDTLPKGSYSARVDGRPKALAGQIYTEFDPIDHMYEGVPKGWEDHDKPHRDWTIRLAIDTHGSTNSDQAVLFSATGPQGHTYFYHEIFEQLLIPTLCEWINDKLAGRKAFNVPLEPGAWIPHPSRGDCMADDFISAGLPVEKGVKDPGRGIQAVKKGLALRDPKTNEPMWRFSPTLTETLMEFDRYVWDAKGKPRDKDDHMMENLHRLAMAELTWIKPSEYHGRIVAPMVVKQQSLSLPSSRGLPLPMTFEPRRPKVNKFTRYRK